jgi:hypothetical protein
VVGIFSMRIKWIVALSLLATACAPGTPEEQFDSSVAADSTASAVLAQLQRDFPSDYSALRTEVIGQLRGGANNGPWVAEAVGRRMGAVMAANRQYLAHTPDTELRAALDAQLAATEAMKTVGVTACANFATGSSASVQTVSTTVQTALTNTYVTLLHGAAVGKQHANDAPRAPLGQPEIAQFGAAMRQAGARDAVVEAALTTGLGGMLTGDQCDGGIATLRAMQAMPGDSGLRLFASVISGT